MTAALRIHICRVYFPKESFQQLSAEGIWINRAAVASFMDSRASSPPAALIG